MIDFATPGAKEKIQIAIKEGVNAASAALNKQRRSVRLSPSSLGEECAAATWYRWRWAMKPQPLDGRMARYNSKGDPEEEIVADLLRRSGWTIHTKDPATGQQFSVSDLSGHLYGKVDGLASHPEHTKGSQILFENKYVNTRRFIALTTKPLIEVDPKYYGQTVLYLLYLDLPAAMFFVGNRNDGDIEPILIPRDDGYARSLIKKGETVAQAIIRPARIAENPTHFKCKMCDYISICHFGAAVDINCRACVNAFPVENGQWKCGKWNAIIPNREAMEAACSEFTPIK